MIKELVVGSAWICPPVEGWLLELLDEPRLAPAPEVEPRPMLPEVPSPEELTLMGLGILLVLLLPPLLGIPDIAARKVVANLVASAFFK